MGRRLLRRWRSGRNDIMSTTARTILWPTASDIVLRAVFLYVGQGASTVLLARDGTTYQTLLLDINLDAERGGINVPALMKDLLEGAPLDVFANSHPHNDHLCGLDKLRDAVTIDAVWHSGHEPSADHANVYQLLQDLIDEVQLNGGTVEELCGSRTVRAIGGAECYVIAPAQHVKDDISDETATERDKRIHEHSAVLRVGVADTWVMLPGDADRDAWELHITDYWESEGKIQAAVLAAPHHGSRSFFVHEEGDDPYLDALDAIDPERVVISAPKREESLHKHPHADAVELYAEHVGEENILHTGVDRHCFVADVYDDGRLELWPDDGQLVAAYGLDGDDGGESGSKAWTGSSFAAPSIRRGSPRDVGEAPPFA